MRGALLTVNDVLIIYMQLCEECEPPAVAYASITTYQSVKRSILAQVYFDVLRQQNQMRILENRVQILRGFVSRHTKCIVHLLFPVFD